MYVINCFVQWITFKNNSQEEKHLKYGDVVFFHTAYIVWE